MKKLQGFPKLDPQLFGGFMRIYENLGVLFKLTLKSTLAVGPPLKKMAIQWRSKQKAQELHSFVTIPEHERLEPENTLLEKRRTMDTNHQWLGSSCPVLGGNFKRGLGPFSTF